MSPVRTHSTVLLRGSVGGWPCQHSVCEHVHVCLGDNWLDLALANGQQPCSNTLEWKDSQGS